MNLVEQIKNQLTGAALGQLSSLIGAGEGETGSAVGAAVPAVLSALSGLASSGGAQKLVSALGHFETGSLGHVANMLSSQPGEVLEQGSGILQTLFGTSTVSGIVNALSRFTGIGSGSAQKLLGYLMPLVLGAIAGRFTGKRVNAQGLTSFLGEQKDNIAHALPSGFSLADVPGVATSRQAARITMDTAQPAAAAIWRWLIPVLAVVALAGVLLWYFYGRTPAVPAVPTGLKVPEFAQVSTDLTGTFKSLTDSLTSIKDVASADTALPKLKELDSKLDGMQALVDKLPDVDKGKVTDLIKASLGKVEDQFTKLVWIPGVGEKVKATLDGIMGKLASLGGLPVPKASQVSAELAGTFSSLTKSLAGIKDSASAEAALPQLTDIGDRLRGARSALEGLSDAGRSTIVGLLKTAMGTLKELSDKVLAMAGVGDKIRPAMDAIMGKLNALVA
jgi:hypothetical protein